MRGIVRVAALCVVLAITGLIVPNSTVASTDALLVEFKHSQGVDLNPDLVWILAVGSDARPGEDMTRVRGDALQLVGMNTKTGAATSIGIAATPTSRSPVRLQPDQRRALLRRPAAARRGGRQPDRDRAGLRLRQPLPVLRGHDQRHRRHRGPNPSPFADDNLKPKGFPAGKVRLNGYTAMAFARIRHDLPGGDFDRSANQQRVLKGIQARIAERADQPVHRVRGAHRDEAHAHQPRPGALFRIAQAVAQVDPKKITNCVVTGGFANVGGASVVTPNRAQAKSYGDQARNDATIERC